jgi:hypothetical protein
MLDGGKIIGGVAIAFVVFAGPIWLSSARGVSTAALAKPAGDICVEAREDMRKNHPALLARWRQQVVRQGDRVHPLAGGRTVPISLTGTCLGCHGEASEFCDKCHAQSAVTLSCWNCHDKEARK